MVPPVKILKMLKYHGSCQGQNKGHVTSKSNHFNGAS